MFNIFSPNTKLKRETEKIIKCRNGKMGNNTIMKNVGVGGQKALIFTCTVKLHMKATCSTLLNTIVHSKIFLCIFLKL